MCGKGKKVTSVCERERVGKNLLKQATGMGKKKDAHPLLLLSPPPPHLLPHPPISLIFLRGLKNAGSGHGTSGERGRNEGGDAVS